MRSRKEIEKQNNLNHVMGTTHKENMQEAVRKLRGELNLEVLLDIRDLIEVQNGLLETLIKNNETHSIKTRPHVQR